MSPDDDDLDEEIRGHLTIDEPSTVFGGHLLAGRVDRPGGHAVEDDHGPEGVGVMGRGAQGEQDAEGRGMNSGLILRRPRSGRLEG